VNAFDLREVVPGQGLDTYTFPLYLASPSSSWPQRRTDRCRHLRRQPPSWRRCRCPSDPSAVAEAADVGPTSPQRWDVAV